MRMKSVTYKVTPDACHAKAKRVHFCSIMGHPRARDRAYLTRIPLESAFLSFGIAIIKLLIHSFSGMI
jgi:hypothetical protein